MIRSSLARSIAVLGTLVGIVVGCDQQQSMDPGNKPEAERLFISVTPDRDSVDVGSTVALTASVLDAKGTARTDQTVRWSSLTPSIASVDGVGLVTGVAVGDARVVAMVGQGSQISTDTATVLVQAGRLALPTPTGNKGTWNFAGPLTDQKAAAVVALDPRYFSDQPVVATEGRLLLLNDE